jgi:hypothetical protein
VSARGSIFALAALAALAPLSAARAETSVTAHVSRNALSVGESTKLEVVVRDAAGRVEDPDIDVPPGVEILGSGRSENLSWINGRSATETVFRYEIAPDAAGQYLVGPIRVQVGTQLFECPAVRLAVTAAPTQVGGGSNAPVTLVADVSPRSPYVGQPVQVRVRLIQRASLAEDPQYTPPTTPGFWAERFSEPESYYAQQGTRRVLVTESRARLIPLAQGSATIGEAVATVVVAAPGPYADPLSWLGGSGQRRELTIRSEPLGVTVRRLPPGAPAGFDGAVGTFRLAWYADRERTSEDVPITVRFEVRGQGNLPLLHTPGLDARDFEVFAGVTDDSLGPPGALGETRRRFTWTLLARRLGRLEVAPPEFSWFDPAAGTYRRGSLAALSLDVEPASSQASESPEAFPAVFAGHPLDPGAQPVAPWAWALCGGALGGAVVLWRASRRAPADAADRAQQREWLRATGLSRGMAFWQAADQASEWLERRGRPVAGLRREITAARYGGAASDLEGARRRVVEELSRAVPPATPAWPLAAGAVVLVLAALAVGVVFGPRPGDGRERLEARAADDAARKGEADRAHAVWQSLWDRGERESGLAARLAWLQVRSGEVGPAAAWVLRGGLYEPRDPALAWVAGRVREGGGLSGARPLRWPVRRIEWALGGLLLGAAAGGLWPRRLRAALAAALAIACAAIDPVQTRLARNAPIAVLSHGATLQGPDLELSPGQVVTLLSRAGERSRVIAGRDIVGWLPTGSLIELGIRR